VNEHDEEASATAQADAIAEVEAFARLRDAAERDPWVALALLAYRYPRRWGPPPESVTVDDLARLAGASTVNLRRWLNRNDE